MIRVGIVDDHPVVRDGLRAALEGHEDLEVAWSATDLAGARRALAGGPCDVVLLDIRLPDGSGLDLIAPPESGGPAFVVLSSWDRPQYARAALERGASGYLLKTAPMEEAVAAVRAAAAGRTTFAAHHLASLRSRPSLTQREAQVVRLVAAGGSNDEIAARLGVSVKTVEAYLSAIYGRWGVGSRTELAIRAEREGWLEPAGEGPREG